MKVLYIGGTGNISAASSRLAVASGIELWHLNRGKRSLPMAGVRQLVADYADLSSLKRSVEGHRWDAVVNWIAYVPGDVQRDFEVFRDRTQQYIFISSASVYQKRGGHPVITESTPLYNPYWDYSRNKIACEEYLNGRFREEGFPITIVRPSLTYDTVIPVAIGSWDDFTIIDRMRRGGEVIVHGDGTSLWTITHSEDFAVGFNGLLGHQQAIGHSFHITSDELLNWNQIYEAVAMAAGAPLRAVHIPSDFIGRFDPFHIGNLLGDKAQSVIFDNSKIKRFVPGFRATIPFAEGIRRTVAWFESDPARMRIVDGNNAFMDRVIAAYRKAG